jgi:phage terminase small subunit
MYWWAFFISYILQKIKTYIRRKKCVTTNIAIVKIAPVIHVDAQQKINANVNNYGD